MIFIPTCVSINEIEIIHKNQTRNNWRDLEVMFKLNNENRYGWLTDSNVIIQQTQTITTPKTIHRYLPNSQLKIIFNGTLYMRKISNLEPLKINKIKMINFEHFNELNSQDGIDDLLSFSESQIKTRLENDYLEESNIQIVSKIKIFLKNLLLLTCLTGCLACFLLLGAYTVKFKFADKANLNSVKQSKNNYTNKLENKIENKLETELAEISKSEI